MDSVTTKATPGGWPQARARLDAALLTPVRALRLAHLPLLMVYFASGAIGVMAIAREFWVKQSLTLSAADLAALGVWLTLPWTIKMVFGELVDTVAIAGSRRRAYVYIGAALVAAGLGLLALAAAGRLTSLSPDAAYKLAMLVIAIGTVLQDVVADTMTTEVVARKNADGSPRDKSDINRDLGMVQVLGRLSATIGALVVALLGGWMASVMPYWQVFALAIAVPVISASGAALVAIAPVEHRPTDWRILGGGLAFGAFALAMAFTDWRWSQEVVFLVSMAVVCSMLLRVTANLDVESKRLILYASILIFVFRSTPYVGDGYNWFTIDVLGFDELFKGSLAQIGALFSLLGLWFFSDAITRQPVTRVLFWLTVALTVLSLPSYALTLGVHHWTERNLGIGARSIALVDSAVTSPISDLSMIPVLTLCALYAPPGWRATWFALMASLMNLALVAANLQTKYVNEIFSVPRGDYANLPTLYLVVLVIGLAVPVAAIAVLGRRIK